MSQSAEYARRVAEFYGALATLDQGAASWDEGYVPLAARRDPEHVEREFERYHSALEGARKRVRQEQIDELLAIQPEWNLIRRAPLGRARFISDVVGRESRVVLLGGAGAGKTTALRYLVAHPPVLRRHPAESGAEGDVLLPIWVQFPLENDLPLPAYLAQDAGQRMSLDLAPEFFEQALVRGQALLLIDGLDEIETVEERAKAVRMVESWAEQFPNSRYVVTARPDGYGPPLERGVFAHYVLDPWNEGIEDELGQAWSRALDAWAVEDKTRPFYVERRRLWLHLALAMRQHESRSAPLEEAQAWLAEAIQHDRRLGWDAETAQSEAGALIGQGIAHLPFVRGQDGRFLFAPRLLHDILAGRALEMLAVDQGVDAVWPLVQGSWHRLSWRETLDLAVRFLAQDHPELADELVSRLLAVEAEDRLESVLYHRLRLAMSVLQDGPNAANEELRERVLDAFVDWFASLQSIKPVDVLEALWVTAPGSDVIDAILDLSTRESLDAWQREVLVLFLGKLVGEQAGRAVEVLEARLDDGQEGERVRLAAAVALAALAGELEPAAIERSIERVRDVKTPATLRGAAIDVLGRTMSQAPRDDVLAALLALARAENGDEKVPHAVQVAAARALSQALAVAGQDSLREQIWGLVQDASIHPEVRTMLAEAVGQAGEGEEAARVLIGIVGESGVHPPVQRAALDALGRVGYATDDIVERLREIARTKDRKIKDFVRLAAARALGELGYLDLALEHLLMMIADKSIYRSTRNEALGYLGRWGSSGDVDLDDAAISVLQVWASEENTTEDIRENAMQVLCWLRARRPDVIQDLVAVAQDRHAYPRVRRAAVHALGVLAAEPKDTIAEALSKSFYDPEEKNDLLRIQIARLLGLWAKDEGALEYLCLAAEQSHIAPVRYAAALVLYELGQADVAEQTLLKLIQDASVSDVIRRDAVRALELWTAGGDEVLDALTSLALDPEAQAVVRQEACERLRTVAAA